jgi:hemoglobin
MSDVNKTPSGDIAAEADVEILVNVFYGKVREDDLLAPVFSPVVQNWNEHLKRMTDFWSTMLLYTKKYHADPLTKHLPLAIFSVKQSTNCLKGK